MLSWSLTCTSTPWDSWKTGKINKKETYEPKLTEVDNMKTFTILFSAKASDSETLYRIYQKRGRSPFRFTIWFDIMQCHQLNSSWPQATLPNYSVVNKIKEILLRYHFGRSEREQYKQYLSKFKIFNCHCTIVQNSNTTKMPVC